MFLITYICLVRKTNNSTLLLMSQKCGFITDYVFTKAAQLTVLTGEYFRYRILLKHHKFSKQTGNVIYRTDVIA